MREGFFLCPVAAFCPSRLGLHNREPFPVLRAAGGIQTNHRSHPKDLH